MKNKSRILLILELALLALLLGSILFLSLFVQAGGRVYFRGVSSLDLRGQEISPETYDTLSRKLPNCSIVWNVPFQGGLISSTETEVTVTSLTDEEVLLLDYLPQLETVHAEACTDYLQLALLQNQINPHFLYNTLACIRGIALSNGVRVIADIVTNILNVRYECKPGKNP